MIFAYFAKMNRGWPLNWHAVWMLLAAASVVVLLVARTVPEENEQAFLDQSKPRNARNVGGGELVDSIDSESDLEAEGGGLRMLEGEGERRERR